MLIGYARTSTSGSFTRSVPSSSHSPSDSTERRPARNLARSLGTRLPMVPPRNATSLGRHEFYQGAGLLDLMRVLSNV